MPATPPTGPRSPTPPLQGTRRWRSRWSCHQDRRQRASRLQPDVVARAGGTDRHLRGDLDPGRHPERAAVAARGGHPHRDRRLHRRRPQPVSRALRLSQAAPLIQQPAGEWWGADPRYRGYRPTPRGAKLDHRVRLAVDLVPAGAPRVLDLGAGDAFVTAELAAAADATVGVSVDVGSPAPLTTRRRPVSRVTARLPGPLPFPAASFDVV